MKFARCLFLVGAVVTIFAVDSAEARGRCGRRCRPRCCYSYCPPPCSPTSKPSATRPSGGTVVEQIQQLQAQVVDLQGRVDELERQRQASGS